MKEIFNEKHKEKKKKNNGTKKERYDLTEQNREKKNGVKTSERLSNLNIGKVTEASKETRRQKNRIKKNRNCQFRFENASRDPW